MSWYHYALMLIGIAFVIALFWGLGAVAMLFGELFDAILGDD